MLVRKLLLLSGIAVLAASSVSAQGKKEKKGKGEENTEAEAKPAAAPSSKPTGLQWSNRDMTYHGQNYDILDSAYYGKGKPQKQFHRYLDHQEIFPPKPRNMMEVGIGAGLYNILGDIPTVMLWQKGGYGLNVHVRKSIGYIFSVRAQYNYGVAKNLDLQPTTAYDKPYLEFHYWPSQFAAGGADSIVYRSTRSETSQMNLDLMFNAGNINFHKARNKMSFYGYMGLGMLSYKTWVDAVNDQFLQHDFNSITFSPEDKAGARRKKIREKLDKNYEATAANERTKKAKQKMYRDFAPSIGLGMQFKINKQFNLQLEDRYTFPMDPYLDGTRYGANLGGTVVSSGRTSDAINYFSVGVNMNIKGKKMVEPLNWINPLDHAYSELSYPRHMILPNPVLPDKDEDGVTDQFDKCPKTPKDLPVDAHGCPLDTDGDGVPDYKDKQLITPTECQPVDADGVGNCPCPDGCKEMVNNNNGNGKTSDKNPCGNIGAGTLLFPEKSNKINKGMEAQLATLAVQMQANPLCKVVIIGGGSGSKVKEQKSWEHVNAVIEHMSEKHSMGRDKFIFKYGEAGDENIVTYRPANVDENGDSNVPPPHPDIR